MDISPASLACERITETVSVNGAERPRVLAHLDTQQLAPRTPEALRLAAKAIPGDVDAVVVADPDLTVRQAMRLAEACGKPLWLTRPGTQGRVILPVPVFDRVCPRIYVPVAPSHLRALERKYGGALAAQALRYMAQGSLSARHLGEYSEEDLARLASIVWARADEIQVADPDCPPEFAQALADRTDKAVSVSYSFGLARFVPRERLASALPMSNEELAGLAAVEASAINQRYSDAEVPGTGPQTSMLRVQSGRLTAVELEGDYTRARAVALSAVIPADLSPLYLFDPECPGDFAALLAIATSTPVRANGQTYAPPTPSAAPQNERSALETALRGEQPLATHFVHGGQLLREDLDEYAMDQLDKLVEALDPALRAVRVLDPDCPEPYLTALAQAAGKPVLHEAWIYLPPPLEPFRLRNPGANPAGYRQEMGLEAVRRKQATGEL